MDYEQYRMKTIQLLGVGLLAGLLWRIELHLRWGWASLDWIGPFHGSVPVGAAVFLLWMAAQLRQCPPRTRHDVIGVSAALGVTAYVGGGMTMGWAYSRWLGLMGGWAGAAMAASPIILYVALGAVYFGMIRWLVQPVTARFRIGMLLYLLAFPFALLLLGATHHKGGPDAIHAIKSGFVFPFIVFSLGYPLVGCGRRVP